MPFRGRVSYVPKREEAPKANVSEVEARTTAAPDAIGLHRRDTRNSRRTRRAMNHDSSRPNDSHLRFARLSLHRAHASPGPRLNDGHVVAASKDASGLRKLPEAHRRHLGVLSPRDELAIRVDRHEPGETHDRHVPARACALHSARNPRSVGKSSVARGTTGQGPRSFLIS